MGAKRLLFTNKAMCFVVAVIALFSTATAFAEVRIVALGDSRIRGYGVPANEAFPAQLEATLRARGHRVTVTNQGVNGDTTQWVLARLDSAVPPGTDIVILWIGANDWRHYNVSRDTVYANRRTIMERLHAKGVEAYMLVNQEESTIDRADLHVEACCFAYPNSYHFNAAGYAMVVRRNLPTIEALVRKVETQGACRPQCWYQTYPRSLRTALTR